MNVLFLTMVSISSIQERGIYTDLLREFTKRKANVFVVTPLEKRNGKPSKIIKEERCSILQVKTGNLTKTNAIEKGIAQANIGSQYRKAIGRYFQKCKFDLILYSTPPIMLSGVISWAKKKYNAKTYLMLKDIFPQNAVDLGLLKNTGIKGLLLWFFRMEEKKLYKISDKIGCMSPANIDYVLMHNPEIGKEKVELFPNCIDPQNNQISEEERNKLREEYGVPIEKIVFGYGGNLGKPQSVPFIIDCIKTCQKVSNAFFLVVGSGTEYSLLENFVKKESPSNFKLLKSLPKPEYAKLIAACDVGLIFLDHRFTIPNYPSRLLSYMQVGIPVLACTDPNTDIGKTLVDGSFGWWCESDDSGNFVNMCEKITSWGEKRKEFGKNSFLFLERNFSVKRVVRTIIKEMGKE